MANVTDARINENKVRLNALWVFMLVIASMFYFQLPVMAFLAADFFIRGFGVGKYSPLGKLSDIAIKQFNIGNKPIYQAPKRFAARIGFVFCLLVIISALLQVDIAAFIASVVLATFAFLESFAGFCTGCYVYSFLLQIKWIRQ